MQKGEPMPENTEGKTPAKPRWRPSRTDSTKFEYGTLPLADRDGVYIGEIGDYLNALEDRVETLTRLLLRTKAAYEDVIGPRQASMSGLLREIAALNPTPLEQET